MTAGMGGSWVDELERAAPDRYLGAIVRLLCELQLRRVSFLSVFLLTASICDYRLSFTATSSRTKEDGSTEERDNKGEIPGPP